MIVCNGDYFLRECLENIYPHAHAICIAEGATKFWADVNEFTSPRSTDRTIDIITSFPDPDRKIHLTQKDGYYGEKDEQCNWWMKLVPADSNYIWQIDSDEFYMSSDIIKMKQILVAGNYTYVEFPVYNFFKNMHTIGVGGSEWAWDTPFPRLFKYRPGFTYTTHRPPTVCNLNGIDLRQVTPLNAKSVDIWMWHYSYVLDQQVLEKMKYYQKVFGRNYMDTWYKNVWLRWTEENKDEIEAKHSTHPTGTGAKTKLFLGPHPEVIIRKGII